MEKTYKFTLPQNKEVEKTNIRVENGEVFVDVELKDKFHPKDGDFLSSSRGNVFIYNGKYTNIQYGAYIGIDAYNTIIKCNPLSAGWTIKEGCRFATPEEKYSFLERLEKECHKRWNEEKKCLEDIYVPKFGDIVKVICSIKGTKRDYMICIVPEHDYDVYNIANIDMGGALSYVCGRINQLEIKPATESERQELFDKLAEVGKRWNPETKQLEDVRWRAERNDVYYIVLEDMSISIQTELYRVYDNLKYESGNYFRTPEAARQIADQIKEIFKNSKAE